MSAVTIDNELDELAQDPGVPDFGADDVVQSWVRSMLPRIVAFASPAIMGLVVAALAWLQNALGVDLQTHAAAYATFIGTLMLGGLGILATWVFNAGRGQVEIAKKALDRVNAEANVLGGFAPDRPQLESGPPVSDADVMAAPAQPPGTMPEARDTL